VYLLELVEHSFSSSISRTIVGASNLSLLILSKNNFSGMILVEVVWFGESRGVFCQ